MLGSLELNMDRYPKVADLVYKRTDQKKICTLKLKISDLAGAAETVRF